MPRDPATIHLHTIQGDTIPIAFLFDEDVTSADFTLTHSLWGTLAATGSNGVVSFAVSELMAAAAVGEYSYTLVIYEGTLGSEQTIARGRHFVGARELV